MTMQKYKLRSLTFHEGVDPTIDADIADKFGVLLSAHALRDVIVVRVPDMTPAESMLSLHDALCAALGDKVLVITEGVEFFVFEEVS